MAAQKPKEPSPHLPAWEETRSPIDLCKVRDGVSMGLCQTQQSHECPVGMRRLVGHLGVTLLVVWAELRG